MQQEKVHNKIKRKEEPLLLLAFILLLQEGSY